MAGLAAIALLGFLGRDVEGSLEPTTLAIPGTPSAKADALLQRHFGPSMPFAILLRGPAGAIERQGPELVRALRRLPGVTTLSPWDRGSVVDLRPGPRRALILADFHDDIDKAVKDTVPELEALLARQVHVPVKATQTGFATLSKALQDASIDAAERGELIALPFLLIVLLLVFRSPIAAAIPLGFGAMTVIASRGLLYLVTGWFGVDAFALTVCTMMGLALGVDYALLMVSRFREELAAGRDPAGAARATRATAGRTTAFAGSTLVLAMGMALLILPGSLLISLAATLIMVVALSVAIATGLGPPLLAMIGPNIDRWRIGGPPRRDSRLIAFVSAALRRPAAAAAIIGVVVAVLAAPALALRTGPPSPEQLSASSPARRDAELIDRAVAPGYEAPFELVAATREGPITDSRHLQALERFQRQVARLPGVQAVIGPGEATRRVASLQRLGDRALASHGEVGAVKQLGTLGSRLGAAAGGVAKLRSGLAEAGAGAGLLAEGSGHAVAGARLLADGLERAGSGSGRAMVALEHFAGGSRKLAEGESEAALAATELGDGIEATGGPNLRDNALRRQHALQGALAYETGRTLPGLARKAKEAEDEAAATVAGLEAMGVGRTDPAYAATLEAARRSAGASGGLAAELEALAARLEADATEARTVAQFIGSTLHEIGRTRKGAAELAAGLYRIHRGGNRLAGGAAKLSRAAAKLGSGIERLGKGAGELASDLGRLTGGAEALEGNLLAGGGKVAPLEGGLEKASVKVIEGHRQIRSQAGKIAVRTPGIFDSGYFVLSALDGAPPLRRRAAGEVIDLRHGGQAAAILAISKYAFNSPGSIRLNRELDRKAAVFGRESGLETGVAGSAAQLNDYSRVTRERIPWVIAAITLATFLVLVAVLRALPLAAIAVGLNLATVGVAFGILTVLSHLPAGVPLGGHHYVDAVGATMIFGIVFGLSIDYAVFLLMRMREHHDIHGDHEAAIRFGLEKTARVITGAAAIMLAVFIAFAGSSLATVSQLGIGLTVAVILDATVVRIVLLPALMLLIGERVWWLPRPLARILPRLDLHG